MIFTQRVFHLQYLFSFNLRSLFFKIKSRPVDAYKSFPHLKKHEFCFVVL